MLNRTRLGTTPPELGESELGSLELGHAELASPEPDKPRLGLSVALDRPFHELKQYLVEEFERAYLTRCLELSAMNLSRASRSSGLSRKHIRTLMSKHGMAARRTLVLDES